MTSEQLYTCTALYEMRELALDELGDARQRQKSVRWRTDLLSTKGHARPLISETIRVFLNRRPSMKPVALKMICALALVIGGFLAAGPVMADKPSWSGAGKGGKDERIDRRDEQRDERRDDGESS